MPKEYAWFSSFALCHLLSALVVDMAWYSERMFSIEQSNRAAKHVEIAIVQEAKVVVAKWFQETSDYEQEGMRNDFVEVCRRIEVDV